MERFKSATLESSNLQPFNLKKMLLNRINLYARVILLFMLASELACKGGGSEEKPKIPSRPVAEEKIALKPAPDFNADSAYAFVSKQVSFGPRVPNTEAHRQCGDYLIAKLAEYGFDTTAQVFEAEAYDGTILQSRNIIASLNPAIGTRILLAAHWDTRPFNDKEVADSSQFRNIDGANDGASGVGVLLEIARSISQSENKPQVGIDLILFDSEDYGAPENYDGLAEPDMWCLGSQHWAKNPHRPGYSAYYGILLDMVGAKDAHFYKEGHSREYAAGINQLVWKIGQQLGYDQYFISRDSPPITDDHYYVNTVSKIPMIDIIDYDPVDRGAFFPDYHHTTRDNMDIIDKNTLKAVGQTVLQTIYNETADIQ